MRQLIKYPGSKWSIAQWICGYMPKHRSYVEPYFGTGAVLFTKKQSAIETVNDIDDNVVNFFEVVRKDPEKLAYQISLTPYSCMAR